MERGPVDIQELIQRLNSSERLRGSSRFSQGVAAPEPIIRTGRDLERTRREESAKAGRYREMHAISRWQEGVPASDARQRSADRPGAGAADAPAPVPARPSLPRPARPHGRWLTTAEHFYQQARAMEDFTDDCPYTGRFSSYYPTYSDMSDRQLRGYFTWRARVRSGDIAQTSTSFAYVYIYELLMGIGVESPRDGLGKLCAFWQSYRALAPDIDRNVRPWIRDYAVYHGLDPQLLDKLPEPDDARAFDLAFLRLFKACLPYDPALAESYPLPGASQGAPSPAAGIPVAGAPADKAPSKRGPRKPALPLPPSTALEDELLSAIDELSTYRLSRSRLMADAPRDLAHVACAVFVRMLGYYRRHRTHGLLETSFGEMVSMSYTMFASAVFFDPAPHADCRYELDPLHRYTCRDGLWTCERIYGGRGRSSNIGNLMHAVDARLRTALDYPHGLAERKTPKYLAKIIDREIADWLSWKEAHAPRKIDIDISKLTGIRAAAAETREALLTDEERDGIAPVEPDIAIAPAQAPAPAAPSAAGPAPMPAPTGDLPALDEPELAFLRALAAGDPAAAREAASAASSSVDMLADRVNEALFDAVGDTVVEFGETGPQIIEDYLEDVKGLIGQ